jgi:phosphoglycerate dehydrogenase-like enzyme
MWICDTESNQPGYALMPAILLAVTGLDPQPWEQRLRTLAPRRDIRLWPQRLGDPADVAYVCAWNAPRGLFARLPRLEAIFSLGAGVDHILADPELPDVPVVRIVDPDLTMRMTEYVVLHVLMQDLGTADTFRHRSTWLRMKRAPPLTLCDVAPHCLRHTLTRTDTLKTIPLEYPGSRVTQWPNL